MWSKSGIESEGQYAFSCELLRTLRFTFEVQTSDQHPWRKCVNSILNSFLLDFRSIQRPKEAEILFGLLRGCDFNGLAPYMSAITANKEKIQILGFVKKGWNSRYNSSSSLNNPENQKVYDDFCQKDLKVLAMLYNEKNKEKCELQLYEPSDLRLTSETAAPTHSTNALNRNQFKLTADILNRLLQDSDLLEAVHEEEDEDKKQSSQALDIYQLNTRTMIMKLINHQLQTNSESFLNELKESNFYQSLLKFVCKESSQEMKGDIMLLEWLEYKCFALRKHACENPQSLVRQRDVFTQLVKDKLYISYDGNGKEMTAVQLKSALNFKNFEEKQEVKLVHANDVITLSDSSKSALKQVLLIDPESLLQRENGLDLLNACEGAITYGVDLKVLIKKIYGRQRTDRDKYLELAQKTVFLVDEQDYKRVIGIVQARSSGSKKSHKKAANAPSEEENFDKVFEQELLSYGGFHPSVAKKTLDKEAGGAGSPIETKTEKLVKLCKQFKEGQIDLDDGNEEDLGRSQTERDLFQTQSNQSSNQSPTKDRNPNLNSNSKPKKKQAEEKSESLQYLKVGFQQYLDKQFSDKQNDNSTKDALFDAVNNFSKQDLPGEYEKTLIRLCNMYCRHVFWSLIQKDDLDSIFSLILETPSEMRAFATFIKVLGNECFITGNKVYKKSYKAFLKKVVYACAAPDSKYRVFLEILLKEGLIQAYQDNLIEDLKNEVKANSERRIEDFFKTESKASQLMNPNIAVPLIRLILTSDPTIIEPFVDRLVSILISLNCLFAGNYDLKEQIWELIVSILEHVRVRLPEMDPKVVKSLLSLRLVKTIFQDFDDQRHHEKSETESVKRAIKDSGTNANIDGVPRKETERLVYARRALCLQSYQRYTGKESTQAIIEMLYKLYHIDKAFTEHSFFYRNNLMSNLDLYSKLIEQGKEGACNEYLLYINNSLTPLQATEIDPRIVTQTFETNHKEYDGSSFTTKLEFKNAEKLLIKLSAEGTGMRPGSALIITSDREGQNVQALFTDGHVKKELAFENVYGDSAYVHYPVYPHATYAFGLNEGDNPPLNMIEQPVYKILERVEEHNSIRYFVTKPDPALGNEVKVYQWKNDQLTRYKDHLDISQVTFGKQCRVLLLKNGKIWAEGRNKGKHIIDSEAEVADIKGQEIPFYEKKDKIVRISTFFQVTMAVTERGKVFAVGDKLSKTCKIDNAKFGFFEVPLGDPTPPKKKNAIALPQKDEIIEPLKLDAKEEAKVVSPPVAVLSDEALVLAGLADIFNDQKHAEPVIVKDNAEAVPQIESDSKAADADAAPVASNEAKEGDQMALQPEQSQPESQGQSLPHQVEGFQEEVQQQPEQQEPIGKVDVEIHSKVIMDEIVSVQQHIEEAKVEQLVDEILPLILVDDNKQQPIEIAQAQPIEEINVQPAQLEIAQAPQLAEVNEEQKAEELPQAIVLQEAAQQDEIQAVQKEEIQQVVQGEAVAQAVDAVQVQPPVSQVEEVKVEEFEMINTDSNPVHQPQGELFALNVWCCRSTNTGELCYMTLVVDTASGITELRSLGHSSFGNLGQGVDIKDSPSFRPVDLPVEVRSIDDVYSGYDYTFVVGKDQNVYAWGSYTSEDKFQFKPVLIKYFQKYIVHKLSGYQRTYALVSPKDNPSKQMVVYGKLAPFVNEDQVKVFDIFSGLRIESIHIMSDKLLVSTVGTYEFQKSLSQQEAYIQKHSQVCELCAAQPQGLLHFFKDKEDNYHYFCQTCVKSGAMTEKYSPDFMWAIKRPILDLEQKPWPHYNAEQMLSEDPINSVLYLTRTKINNQEIKLQLTFDDICEDNASRDMNPLIYLRVNRPLKEDAKMDLINLEQFYTLSKYNGVSLRVTPDYTFNEKSDALITKNQPSYDSFKKALNEILSLDANLQKQFKQKVEEFVAKKIKEQAPHEIKIKELKITEDTLKFNSEKLQELSEDCKRLHIGKFLQYLQYLWGSYSYIYRQGVHSSTRSDFGLLKIFNLNKHKIPLLLKNKILKRLTESLSNDDSTISIHVNRKRASEFIETGKVDEKGEYTVFGQVQRGLQNKNYQGMRINQSDKKAWFVKFIGEFALDQGGLFRESLTELCQELQSPVLNLLVKTQNNKNNHGENRDKWTLNPSATSPTQIKMLEFLGALIGLSVRSGILMSLNLPAFVWKQLTDEELNVDDLNEIDQMTVTVMNDLKSIDTQKSEEDFLLEYELNFTTILSNGEEVELVTGGKTKRVNFSNMKEYVKKSITARLQESRVQIKHIKKGIDATFDSKFLRLLSWKDLQYKVVGKDVIDIDRLKELTTYRNCSETHDTIKKFWKILNSFTNDEKALYLKFVWGRTRLPLKEEEVTENHTVQLDDHADIQKLPLGRTCFFRLEIPAYKNEEVFKDKLLYAIRHCTAIDADIEGAVHNEEEQVADTQRRDQEGEEAQARRDRGDRDGGDDEGDDNNYEDQEDQDEDNDDEDEGNDNDGEDQEVEGGGELE